MLARGLSNNIAPRRSHLFAPDTPMLFKGQRHPNLFNNQREQMDILSEGFASLDIDQEETDE
jgi:hypothetical protein